MLTWVLLGLLGVWSPPPQDPEPEYVEVRLVQIEVRVSDREGNPIRGLTRRDFQLKEEGELQEIRGVRFVSVPVPESGRPPSPTAPEGSVQEAAAVSAEPTWVYIACEFGTAAEFVRAFPGIRRFIAGQLQPGFRISLAGMPFTSSPEVLEAILERLARSPYGDGTVDPVIDYSFTHMSDLELERRLAEAIQQEQGQISSMPGFGFDPLVSGRMDQMNYYSVERIDRQLPLFGRLALYRYQELIERISLLSGKKVIVLFRPGLPLDKDTAGLMERVTALAVKHRVSFYTMDPKGLETGIDIDNPRAALPWAGAASRRHSRGAVLSDEMRRIDYQSGLASLASGTGGKALDNLNDMGAILDAVAVDARDYYVLDYTPSAPAGADRFRKISVTVSFPGARVEAVKGYFEPGDSSGGQEQARETALYRALLGNSPEQFPITGNLQFFADERLEPILISSVGVHPLDFMGSPRKLKDARLEMATLTRVSPMGLTLLPTYNESRTTYQLSKEDLESAGRDETARVSINEIQTLPPGQYRWQTVVQNLESGDLGILELGVMVPDFKAPSTPSSLLLTRRVERVGDGKPPGGPKPGILEADGLRYVPEPGREFHQGDVIFALLNLYNPTEADIAAARAGMQMGLLRGRSPVHEVRAGGQPIVLEDRPLLQYAAFIETLALEPGPYKVFLLLPDSQNRSPAAVEANFVLLPRVPQP